MKQAGTQEKRGRPPRKPEGPTTMKITLVQTDIKWCSPQENMQRAEAAIASNPGSELYILPEMFTTGFCMEPQEAAEPQGGAGLAWMADAARRHNAAIAGSIAVEEGGKYYNRFYFVRPDGGYAQYDKVHLFTYSGEDKVYTKGTERKIIEYRGIRILPIICYDLRFPVFIRNRKEYDLIICVANWPAVRSKPWCTLIRARAIENQCYIIAANRTASHDAHYIGYSAVIDYAGRTIAQARDRIAQTVTATISKAALDNARATFPALADADNFNIFI